MMSLRILAAALAALAMTTGASAVEPKGTRILAIVVNEGPGANYGSSFAAARAVGMQAVELSLNWDDIERAPGIYRPDPNWLAIANRTYPGLGIKVALVINPIDTVADRRPRWLRARPWDDPVVIGAYVRMVAWAMATANSLDLVSLALGNEVDVLLGGSVADWNAYTAFAAAARRAIKASHPALPIGTKTTLTALRGSMSKYARSLHRRMDVVLLTYYPLNDDFTVKPPSSVAADFSYAVNVMRGKVLHFAEIGYPTSAKCGSSAARQAEFVRQAFAAWDRYSEQIAYMNFVWLNDISKAELDAYLQYYGGSNRCFAQYLATLGLRRGGVDKPAYEALVVEAHRRGW